MPAPQLLHSLRLFDLLVNPIRSILGRLLPDIVEVKLRDPKFRQSALIPLIDKLLVSQVPEAAAIPRSVRLSVIRRVMDTLIDDILISDGGPAAAPRRRNATSAAAVVSEVPHDLPPPDIGLGVRSITIRSAGVASESLRAAVLAVTGENWTFRDFPGLEGFHEVEPVRGDRPTVPEAWELARVLASLPGVEEAEPSIAQLPEVQVEPVPRRRSGGQDAWKTHHGVKETKTAPEWSLQLIKAKELWGTHGGKGILIGHIDTGYTRHPESIPNIDTARGYDTWDKDSDALDDLDPSFWDRLRTNLAVPAQPGHGTSTASVIVSPRGKQSGHASPNGVTGTAPQATIIPIRATPTVVILPTGSQGEVASGILAAVQRGVHVISMSLGSPWGSSALEAAVRHALESGVIVCAAAGNVVLKETWFTEVMYPAAYPGVVAVAGCDYHRRPWRDSCRGSRVVVTAPATDVWKAEAVKENRTIRYSVGQGSGTSFAVAATAGVAACWLRHWSDHFGSRRKLIDHLGGHPRAVPVAFLDCIRRHQAQPISIPGSAPADLPQYPRDFRRDQFGVGVIDVAALSAVVPTASRRRSVVASTAPRDPSAVIAELSRVSGHPAAEIRRALQVDLGIGEAAFEKYLKAYGRELLHHFGTDADLRRRLDALLQPPTRRTRSTPAPAGESLASRLRLVASPSAAAALK